MIRRACMQTRERERERESAPTLLLPLARAAQLAPTTARRSPERRKRPAKRPLNFDASPSAATREGPKSAGRLLSSICCQPLQELPVPQRRARQTDSLQCVCGDEAGPASGERILCDLLPAGPINCTMLRPPGPTGGQTAGNAQSEAQRRASVAARPKQRERAENKWADVSPGEETCACLGASSPSSSASPSP